MNEIVVYIKEFLIKHFNANSWENYVDIQQFGDCAMLCELINKNFPNVFDCIYNCDVDYSPIAIKKLNDIGDFGEMFGNHYILSRKGVLYDFGKGTNSINGIYTLTQKDDMSDKYKVNLSKGEKNQIIDKIRLPLIKHF